jgi:uncharacterized protein
MFQEWGKYHLPSGLILCLWNLSLLAGCNRAPPEPESSPGTGADQGEPDASATAESNEEPPSPQAAPLPGLPQPSPSEEAECVVPLPEAPAPPASSVTNCPSDPDGRPEMPSGQVSFPDAPKAPRLTVELALNSAHRSHGLMFRPTLQDTEGMLFSWEDERRRSFWMKNTCLALDMLFIARDLTIAGVAEQVPPMNELPRGVNCPAAHVLEVPSGWVRKYGVAPGQKISIDAAE